MGARRVVWTEEMIATVRENAGVLTPASIAGLLGLQDWAVRDLMRARGWLRWRSTGFLGQLTAEERTAYDALLRGKAGHRLDALELIGRGDLVEAARREPVPFQGRVRVRRAAA